MIEFLKWVVVMHFFFGVFFACLSILGVMSMKKTKNFKYMVWWKGELRELDFFLGATLGTLITIFAWEYLLIKHRGEFNK